MSKCSEQMCYPRDVSIRGTLFHLTVETLTVSNKLVIVFEAIFAILFWHWYGGMRHSARTENKSNSERVKAQLLSDEYSQMCSLTSANPIIEPIISGNHQQHSKVLHIY